MPLPDKKHTIADDIIVTNHTMMPDANEDSYIRACPQFKAIN